MNYDDYINLLSSTLKKQMIKSSSSYLIKRIAFLSWGPMGPILNFFLDKAISFLLKETELALYLKFTDFRVSRQGKVFYEAMVLNQEALKKGDPDEIKKAEDRLINDFRALIKLRN